MDRVSFRGGVASAAGVGISSVVSDRKISSRLIRIGRSSSRPQPLDDDRARQIAAHVVALLALDLVPDDAVAAVGFDDARHAGERG